MTSGKPRQGLALREQLRAFRKLHQRAQAEQRRHFVGGERAQRGIETQSSVRQQRQLLGIKTAPQRPVRDLTVAQACACAVDVAASAGGERRREQDVVDAQAEIAAEGHHPVVPPGKLSPPARTGGRRRSGRAWSARERPRARRRNMDSILPVGMRVTILGGDVVVAEQCQTRVARQFLRPASASARRARQACRRTSRIRRPARSENRRRRYGYVYRRRDDRRCSSA